MESESVVAELLQVENGWIASKNHYPSSFSLENMLLLPILGNCILFDPQGRLANLGDIQKKSSLLISRQVEGQNVV